MECELYLRYVKNGNCSCGVNYIRVISVYNVLKITFKDDHVWGLDIAFVTVDKNYDII